MESSQPQPAADRTGKSSGSGLPPSFAWQIGALDWQNQVTATLPIDPSTLNQARIVQESAVSRVKPAISSKPELLAWAPKTAKLLGFSEADMPLDTAGAAQILSGNVSVEGADPYAMCYGGHQFGHWAGQLGDGRAINLGEVKNGPTSYMLQLKGAGPTPYSRGADGFAVLRSSIREFLCSHAMSHLGVPTSLALSLTATGDNVMRDMFYDGRGALEPTAVVCRVAESFFRFGSFEIFCARGDVETLSKLVKFVGEQYFPQVAAEFDVAGSEFVVAMFKEICESTSRMIVDWMRVGFVHGVMNTDNMSIHGITIDYGPYGWVDNFDRSWTPNTTDFRHKRYTYGNQPNVALWNLAQLGRALVPLVGNAELLSDTLAVQASQLDSDLGQMWHQKLGLSFSGLSKTPEIASTELVDDLHQLLEENEVDMTMFFRLLAEIDVFDTKEVGNMDLIDPIMPSFYQNDEKQTDFEAIADWLRRYVAFASANSIENTQKARINKMNQTNPKYVLRNYMAQQAIEAAGRNDVAVLTELQEVLEAPYSDAPEHEKYFAKRPEWARNKPGCSTLSCSS